MASHLRHLIIDTARSSGFSGVARVTVSGDTLASVAFGHADRDRGVDNTPDTRFGMASGTKLLTALGIGVLIDDGRLSLGARLREISSLDLRGVASDVTIEHLLSHTSGVYDYYDEEIIENFDSFEVPTPPGALLRPMDYLPMVTAGAMKFTPGERFCYSNGGYVLLGILIEELCGDFHEFIESRVMHRAGMESSGFFRLDHLPEGAATGYAQVDGQWRSNIDKLPVVGGPDGGAFVSTHDMQRLWHALFSGQVITRSLARLFARKAARHSDAIHYGHGMWIRDDGVEPPVIYVEGCDAGVSFKSSCHGENVIATVAGNTSDAAWPVAKAIDGFLRRELEPGERRFSFSD